MRDQGNSPSDKVANRLGIQRWYRRKPTFLPRAFRGIFFLLFGGSRFPSNPQDATDQPSGFHQTLAIVSHGHCEPAVRPQDPWELCALEIATQTAGAPGEFLRQVRRSFGGERKEPVSLPVTTKGRQKGGTLCLTNPGEEG